MTDEAQALLPGMLKKYQHEFLQVVPFDPLTQKLLAVDMTEANTGLQADILDDTAAFSKYMLNLRTHAGAAYGFGGYAEYRNVYSRSKVFNGNEFNPQPRRFHLGIDIWGPAGTPVFAPLSGFVHSFAFNDRFGDYGATIILSHQLEGLSFHTLYGHLSLADIGGLQNSQFIVPGQEFGHFGEPAENGQWPPHLHFQVISDIGMYEGDYPGVCSVHDAPKYLKNCPDPDLLLNLRKFL